MGTDRTEMGARLREERERISYSQAAFAREVSMTREGLRLCEKGESGLNGEMLARAAALGVDVQYVLTGVRSQNLADAERAARPTVNVSDGGSANVVQLAQPGATVTLINTQRHVTRTKAEVKPGDQHISDAQASTLVRLVDEVVETEGRLKRDPKTHRAVWSALNAHCKVPSYRLIAIGDFEKAEKYLRQWIGRLNSMASAPVADNDVWRKKKYAFIKINTKDDEAWLSGYLRKNFKASSLTEISDDDLDRTYRAVAARKRAAPRKGV